MSNTLYKVGRMDSKRQLRFLDFDSYSGGYPYENDTGRTFTDRAQAIAKVIDSDGKYGLYRVEYVKEDISEDVKVRKAMENLKTSLTAHELSILKDML